MDKPSNGISIVKENKSSVFYHLSCDCMAPEHTYVVELNYDTDVNDLTFHIYSEMCVQDIYHDNWFIRQWNKIKGIFKIIFGIPLIFTSSVILTGETEVDDFIKALEYGKEHIKQNRKL